MKTEDTNATTAADTTNTAAQDADESLIGKRVRIDPNFGDDGNGPNTAWAGLYGEVSAIDPFAGYLVKIGRKTRSFNRMDFDPVDAGAATPSGKPTPAITVVNPLPPPSAADTTLRMAAPLLAINSPTNPRRRHGLDIDSLNAMAASLKAQGVVQPILVRPLPSSRLAETSHLSPRPVYELVSGERRWRGAQIAELATMPMLIRDLSDQAVIELQLVENIEREDLDAMEEAEGFELLRTQLGYTVDQIADRIGRGRGVSYVRKSMKLLDLSPESREAMYAGDLGRSTGLLVARYPAERQAEVVAFIKSRATKTPNGKVPAPFREIAPALHRFNTDLADASFDPEDADLVPAAGACSACPKRTGNKQDLFGDADQMEPDNCTDANCFESKKNAHVVRIHDQAKAKGLHVISPEIANQAKPYPYGTHLHGFVRLTDVAYTEQGDDDKEREVTFEDALRAQGKKAPKPQVFIDPHTGKDTQVISIQQADKLTPEEGETVKPKHMTTARREALVKSHQAAVPTQPPEIYAVLRRDVRQAALLRSFDVIRNRARTIEELRRAAMMLIEIDGPGDALATYMQWDGELDGLSYEETNDHLAEKLCAMNGEQLGALVAMLSLETRVDENLYNEEDGAVAMFSAYGIDVLAVQEKVDEDLAKLTAKKDTEQQGGEA
jgi:ParB/RepB/Spo0J family partition protein